MKLLAWDTSSKSGAIVALEFDPSAPREEIRVVSEWSLNVSAAQHSERLLWGIHQMLECCGWKLEDVDHFGVGVGPGSFTGLRIGITTARTLASTLKKPLIGVSSLAALARPIAVHFAGITARKTILVASTDAAKGELFTLIGSAKSVLDCVALHEGDFPGVWKKGVEEDVMTPETIEKIVRRKLTEAKTETQWVRIGEGRKRYPALWESLPKDQEAECPLPAFDHVQGRYLGLLCWEALQAGLAREALLVHPRYLRESDAEKNLKAGKLPKGPTRGGSA